eukprot:13995448-Alexandrium_andersonii.AAC.1
MPALSVYPRFRPARGHGSVGIDKVARSCCRCTRARVFSPEVTAQSTSMKHHARAVGALVP